MLPQARRHHLTTRKIGDETMVYDRERHCVHCLSPAAALIWRLCDGRTPVAEIARRAATELGTALDEEVVWVILQRLERASLLQALLLRPRGIAGLSRRHAIALGLAGAAALLLPGCGVDSVTAPSAGRPTGSSAPIAPAAVGQERPSPPLPSVPPPSPTPPPPSTPPPSPSPPPPISPCGAASQDFCSSSLANLPDTLCQAHCANHDAECQDVAPRDRCVGRFGPAFKRDTGQGRQICRRCTCVCGEFIPGR
jgi:Coenzyme PQQ synthesis protein D (PqqD)